MDYKGNIKVGSTVICVKNMNTAHHGSGWIEGKIFIVDRITKAPYGYNNGGSIVWPGGKGHGVFIDCVLPVNLLPEEFFKI